MLAAELAAVQRLIDVARLGGMRFAIVSYSGRDDFPLEDSVTQRVDRRDARLEAELTDDPAALEAAVARVARRGSDGASSFAPAMRLALRSSRRASDSREPARRRRVLFLSDSPTPVRFAPMDRIAHDDPRMEIEARRAIQSGVSFHSFGLGEAADDADTPHALAQIAGATGGTYRAVPDPRDLYCQMLAALGASDPRPALNAAPRSGFAPRLRDTAAMLRPIVLALTVCTGFTGLAYEITWQKYLAILLGAHSEATATVLGLFLGGLSLGYWLFGALTRALVERGRQQRAARAAAARLRRRRGGHRRVLPAVPVDLPARAQRFGRAADRRGRARVRGRYRARGAADRAARDADGRDDPDPHPGARAQPRRRDARARADLRLEHRGRVRGRARDRLLPDRVARASTASCARWAGSTSRAGGVFALLGHAAPRGRRARAGRAARAAHRACSRCTAPSRCSSASR